MPATKKAGSKKPGLYANIQAKHERIEHGSGEHMREPGEKGAPSFEAFERSAKTGTTSKKATRKIVAKKASAKAASARSSAAKTTAARKTSSR